MQRGAFSLGADISPYATTIYEASSQYGITPALLVAIMEQESRGINGQTSHAGASGIMQLMPRTAAALGVTDRNDPNQSIWGAAKLMREELDRFGGDVNLALAAYNAGSPAVRNAGNQVPNIRETQDYVTRVNANLGAAEEAWQAINPANLQSRNPNTTVPPALHQAQVSGQQSNPLQASNVTPQQQGVSGTQNVPTTSRQNSGNSINTTGTIPTIQPVNVDTSAAQNALQNIQYDAAIQGIRQANQVQQTAIDRARGRVSTAELPDYARAARAEGQVRTQYANDVNQIVTDANTQLEVADATRRENVQQIYGQQNFDPLNPNSEWNAQIAAIAQIGERARATVQAEQWTNDADVFSNPATAFYRTLFGNPYTQGRQELQAQAATLATITKNVTTQLAEQTRVANAATVKDTGLIQSIANNSLKAALASRDASLAVQTGDVAAAEKTLAAVNQLNNIDLNIAQAQSRVAQGNVDIANIQSQAAENQVRIAQLPIDALNAQTNAATAQLRAQSLQQDINSAPTQFQLDQQRVENQRQQLANQQAQITAQTQQRERNEQQRVATEAALASSIKSNANLMQSIGGTATDTDAQLVAKFEAANTTQAAITSNTQGQVNQVQAQNALDNITDPETKRHQQTLQRIKREQAKQEEAAVAQAGKLQAKQQRLAEKQLDVQLKQAQHQDATFGNQAATQIAANDLKKLEIGQAKKKLTADINTSNLIAQTWSNLAPDGVAVPPPTVDQINQRGNENLERAVKSLLVVDAKDGILPNVIQAHTNMAREASGIWNAGNPKVDEMFVTADLITRKTAATIERQLAKGGKAVRPKDVDAKLADANTITTARSIANNDMAAGVNSNTALGVRSNLYQAPSVSVLGQFIANNEVRVTGQAVQDFTDIAQDTSNRSWEDIVSKLPEESRVATTVELAKAAISYNNKYNNYKKLGLPIQSRMIVNIDDTRLDLSKRSDVQAYIKLLDREQLKQRTIDSISNRYRPFIGQ